MSKKTFIFKEFNPRHQRLIELSETIMNSYRDQGYDLSLRQLYYQHVARFNYPNTEQSYKLLGGVISDARLAGKLDWDMLVDRGRETVQNSHWTSPTDIIRAAVQSYKIDMWKSQPKYVEVMVEKQALEGVLLPVCSQLDVPFSANKGYSSSSAMYAAGQRIKKQLSLGKEVTVVYLGDHDPSGMDMGRDVLDRLALFAGAGCMVSDKYEMEENGIDKPGIVVFDKRLTVKRVALNYNQIKEYNPPPNPAKVTDSRIEGYLRKFGRESWELDALEPSVLARIVREAITDNIDEKQWELDSDRRDRHIRALLKFEAQYKEENPEEAE